MPKGAGVTELPPPLLVQVVMGLAHGQGGGGSNPPKPNPPAMQHKRPGHLGPVVGSHAVAASPQPVVPWTKCGSIGHAAVAPAQGPHE